MIEATLNAVGRVGNELMLFAAFGFILGGISDFALDLAWATRAGWRRLFVCRGSRPASVATLTRSANPLPIVVFVPAWDEADVIGPMLRTLVARWPTEGWRVLVGTYPNDPATSAAVCALGDRRIRAVVGAVDGPTTKAHCLNELWRALLDEEAHGLEPTRAIVLHDAEDVVHRDEIAVYDALIGRFDLIQLPVVPIVSGASRWVGGHYADEFAESHGKTIVVREAIGAAIPAAGVGCAFSRDFLATATAGADGPFDADSLTEDYELGLRLRELGGRSAFVRIRAEDGGIVAVRAHFPDRFHAAVTQKARWIAGIALSGWDRLGWRPGFAERWMRSEDRRVLAAALMLVAAYTGIALTAFVHAAAALGIAAAPIAPSQPEAVLFTFCLAMFGWRLAMRAGFVWRTYGWRQAFWSIPRVAVSNTVAILAAWRAIGIYRASRRSGVVRWTKTRHRFPDDPDAQ